MMNIKMAGISSMTLATCFLLFGCGEEDPVAACDALAGAGLRSEATAVNFEDIKAEEALVPCQKAVEKAPNDGVSWLNLGRVYRRLDQGAKADEVFHKAISLGTTLGYLYLGNMYADGSGAPKDESKAIENYRAYAASGAVYGFGADALSYLLTHLPSITPPASTGSNEPKSCPLNRDLAILATKVALATNYNFQFETFSIGSQSYREIVSDGDTVLCNAGLQSIEMLAADECIESISDRFDNLKSLYPEIKNNPKLMSKVEELRTFGIEYLGQGNTKGQYVMRVTPRIRFNLKSGELAAVEFEGGPFADWISPEKNRSLFAEASAFIEANRVCTLASLDDKKLLAELGK